MKAVLRQITSTPNHSFLIRKDRGKDMVNNWHYHPEIELLFIIKSSGTWLIGDHIGHYQSGDIVLIGPDLPHCFMHEDPYTVNGTGETICVKFLPHLFGQPFLSLPEARGIRNLLAESHCGLMLLGKTKLHLAKMMEKLILASPGKKLVYLLSMLEEIAENKEYIKLSSKGFMQLHDETAKERIKIIFDYTFNHYAEKISIEEVAMLLNMTPQSFCRYFKSKTNKTYLRFLIEVRIGYACRLLVEDEKNISEISYHCGYNNISHFNHQFKMITGKQPLEYKKDYLKTELRLAL